MIACENSGHIVSDDFAEVSKIVEAGVTSKPTKDYELSRYAFSNAIYINAFFSVNTPTGVVIFCFKKFFIKSFISFGYFFINKHFRASNIEVFDCL